MVDLKSKKYIYFIGVGGIGMSALARYLFESGYHVLGYDKTETHLTDELIKEGIGIVFQDEIELIDKSILRDKSEVLVVYTPAIPKDHLQLNYLIANGYDVIKRSDLLGVITNALKTIAIAGTHGKTTISSMVANILAESDKKYLAFLGGILKNINSNMVLNSDAELSVVEADEYDRSFLKLFPHFLLISSMDADHLDIYGDKNELEKSFNLFTKNLSSDGKIVANGKVKSLLNKFDKTYGLQDSDDYYPSDLSIIDHKYHFNLNTPKGEIKDLTLGLPGLHNLENAVGASAICLEAGLSESAISNGLSKYLGVQRRFEYVVNTDDVVYIDDYAHHPEEITRCIESVKILYPTEKITAIFQPHLFSRTRDFADEFAKSLAMADELILLEIYPARELPINGIDSSFLLKKVDMKSKMLCSKDEMLNELSQRDNEVILSIGAGDIGMMVNDIKKTILSN